MTYWEETIPADANPGPLVHTALATKLLALGWTLEDTVVIGTRTHEVYKSAAAGNTYGLDWYLDVSYPTTGVATGLLLTPFEGYNAATDLATRGPYSPSDTNIDATTYSRFGATASALETNWANSGANHTSLDTPLTTASFAILASVTRDRVILCSTTEGAQVTYTGFFTPTAEHAAHAGAALFPLITVRLSGASDRTPNSASGSVQAALTRVPKFSAINWSVHCVVSAAVQRMNGKVGGVASSADAQVTSAPFVVGMGSTLWTTGNTSHVGELDGVECAWADAGVVRGDTVNSDTYATSTAVGGACILIEKV